MPLTRLAPALLLAAACLLAAATLAAADRGKQAAPAQRAAAAAPGKPVPATVTPAVALLRGYTLVSSPILAAPAGRQTHGAVDCPAGLVPLGGSAFIQSGSTVASINSSFPTPTGWAADVNDASAADTTFEVLAFCAERPT